MLLAPPADAPPWSWTAVVWEGGFVSERQTWRRRWGAEQGSLILSEYPNNVSNKAEGRCTSRMKMFSPAAGDRLLLCPTSAYLSISRCDCTIQPCYNSTLSLERLH